MGTTIHLVCVDTVSSYGKMLGTYRQTLTETDTEERSRVREIDDMYARAVS
ncbi:hypothetical protein DPMN_100965 [Dreissena polymorpha]|uniref:Uncharacterized protein n=1 Tax=Dreissena polymorpha TaxID=45954 RepID=A0A9D4LJ37_DREPO|nr:hypothetical protein DPMN_100965 [Dreissena polymorpha]